MKLRLITAAALVGALSFCVIGAQAGSPVLDGKKVKVLTVTANGGLQDNDKDFAGGPERVDCQAPRCTKLAFVYKPAKGIKGGLMLTAKWSNPASDMDLYLALADKRGNLTQVGSCGGSASTSEKVYLAPSELKVGRTYVMVVDHYRSLNETVTAKVEIDVPSTIKSTVPTAADSKALVNCSVFS